MHYSHNGEEMTIDYSCNGEETMIDYNCNGVVKEVDRHIVVVEDDEHNWLGKVNYVHLLQDLQYEFDACQLELQPTQSPLLQMFGISGASKRLTSTLLSSGQVRYSAPICLLPWLPVKGTKWR